MVLILTVALIGLETIKNHDGSTRHFSETFLNNIYTYKTNNGDKEEEVVSIDARDFKDEPLPLTAVWKRLRKLSKDRPINKLIYSGHSGLDELYFFSKVREELPEKERYIKKTQSWEGILFSPDAEIWIWGCQAAGQQGVKSADSICQAIANATKTSTYGYLWKTSQKKRNGGYYQVPDRGIAVRCVPIS